MTPLKTSKETLGFIQDAFVKGLTRPPKPRSLRRDHAKVYIRLGNHVVIPLIFSVLEWLELQL